MIKRRSAIKVRYLPVFFLFVAFGFSSCTSQKNTAQAEEYYSIGMAYFELGKFSDAEFWLNRARTTDKTMVASEYNLGRIAFETGRYEEAAKLFEKILDLDPRNAMALRAAAYSRIKNGDIEKAEALYDRVLEIIPESADDGFNYALVLYGLEKYEDCEEVLNKYPFALEEKASSILLLARAQKALKKVEAVDSYAKWLLVNTGTANPQGLYEYGQVLESAGFYARALEQYREAIKALPKDTANLKRSKLLFEEARLLMTIDPGNDEGITGFKKAVDEGFKDTEAIEALLADERISKTNKEEIGRILDKILDELSAKEKAKEETKEETETEENGEET